MIADSVKDWLCTAFDVDSRDLNQLGRALEYENYKECLYPHPNIRQVDTVEQFGGEGQGDQLWLVVRIVFADDSVRYYRLSGWYASFDGGEYDGPFEEVRPTIVEKTEWVKL